MPNKRESLVIGLLIANLVISISQSRHISTSRHHSESASLGVIQLNAKIPWGMCNAN